MQHQTLYHLDCQVEKMFILIVISMNAQLKLDAQFQTLVVRFRTLSQAFVLTLNAYNPTDFLERIILLNMKKKNTKDSFIIAIH